MQRADHQRGTGSVAGGLRALRVSYNGFHGPRARIAWIDRGIVSTIVNTNMSKLLEHLLDDLS